MSNILWSISSSDDNMVFKLSIIETTLQIFTHTLKGADSLIGFFSWISSEVGSYIRSGIFIIPFCSFLVCCTNVTKLIKPMFSEGKSLFILTY